MQKVTRDSILDYVTYEEQRHRIRTRILDAKARRRVHLGEHLTFLFENTETIRYQIQEMVRTERIVKEADIRHELDTYNELLGAPGELGCTLLIEIEDAGERVEKLTRWRGLVEHIYVLLDDGSRVYASFDPRQVAGDRLSSVHYLKFGVHGRAPLAVGSDFEGSSAETRLSDEQREALDEDLKSDQ
jgi:hypothetical protein